MINPNDEYTFLITPSISILCHEGELTESLQISDCIRSNNSQSKSKGFIEARVDKIGGKDIVLAE